MAFEVEPWLEFRRVLFLSRLTTAWIGTGQVLNVRSSSTAATSLRACSGGGVPIEIGRASCRERVWIPVVPRLLQKKPRTTQPPPAPPAADHLPRTFPRSSY